MRLQIQNLRCIQESNHKLWGDQVIHASVSLIFGQACAAPPCVGDDKQQQQGQPNVIPSFNVGDHTVQTMFVCDSLTLRFMSWFPRFCDAGGMSVHPVLTQIESSPLEHVLRDCGTCDF